MSAGQPWRGSGPADVLVLDVPVLGEAECRRRVLASWQPGAAVHALHDGRWVLRLPEPVHVRAERAPGVPLRTADDGILRWSWRGRAEQARVDDLAPVDVSTWVDLSALPVEHLAGLEPPAPLPDVVAEDLPGRPTVDLAARARVRPEARRDAVAAALAQRLARGEGTGGRGPAGGRGASGRGTAGSGRGAGGQGVRRAGSGALARLVLGGPGGSLVARRHARYVEELARQLEAGQYDEALRRAISLAGGVGSLSLRLPGARRDLRPSTGPRQPGTAIAVGGDTVEAVLGRHYRDAAAALERDGRVEEAAYVLADLLDRPLDAVRMLERRGRLVLAAQLAEARELPDAAIRLWWKAGSRDRAVVLARRADAFAQVAALLGPDEDLEWRREWLQFRRDAGDPAGAVGVAWPRPALRDEVQGDLAAAMSLGGPEGAKMFALAVAHRPTPAAVAAAVALLDTPPAEDDVARDGRSAFLQTLARWPVSEPAADRRLSTAAARLLVREPAVVADLPPATRKTTSRDLQQRADPLAVADLARRAPLGSTARPEDRTHVLAGRGELAPLDAAVVRTGVLVAHGGAGTRLYGPAGQVLAAWDVPADRLVVADHGTVALLAVVGERSWELHRLDLVTRRTSRWAVAAVQRTASTYDGASLVVVDDTGIATWDTTGEAPRVVRRQPLDRGEEVLDLARSPHALAATLRADGFGALQPGVHLWRWSLPDGLLRSRVVLDLGNEPVASAALRADGALVTTATGFSGPYVRRWLGAGAPLAARLDDPTTTYVGTGPGIATLSQRPDGVLVTSEAAPHAGGWSVRVHGSEQVAVRQQGSTVVVRSWDGRVLAFDATTGRVAARFTTSASPRRRADAAGRPSA